MLGESCKKLSSGFSRLRTLLDINVLEIAYDGRSKQSCTQDIGTEDAPQGMSWLFSTEITPSVVCVSK
jgi:hypothetical protein